MYKFLSLHTLFYYYPRPSSLIRPDPRFNSLRQARSHRHVPQPPRDHLAQTVALMGHEERVRIVSVRGVARGRDGALPREEEEEDVDMSSFVAPWQHHKSP